LKRARAQQEAHVAMATLQGTQVELSAAQANHHEAAKQLESLVEQLRGVDSELNNIR
jgi:phosphotransferase system HPr-like phosphotransfer protein